MKPLYIQLGISVFIFVVAATAYGISYVNVQSESNKAAQLAEQLKEKSLATTRIAQAKAQLAILAPQEAAINQYFVSPSDIVPFLEQFSATGKFLGADVQVVSVSAVPGASNGVLNLSLKITGPFVAVLRTLGSIEYGPYDITTNSLALDAAKKDSDTNTANTNSTWTAELTIVIATQAAASTTQSTASLPSSVPTTPTAAASTSAVQSGTTTKPSVAI